MPDVKDDYIKKAARARLAQKGMKAAKTTKNTTKTGTWQGMPKYTKSNVRPNRTSTNTYEQRMTPGPTKVKRQKEITSRF